MKNKKGQSLIEIVFSIGIVVLVMTGAAILVVNTTKAKTMTLERQKAVEVSQKLIENKISSIKNNPLAFWDGNHDEENGYLDDYNYKIEYNCNPDKKSCNIFFTVNWGNNQSLKVERFFSRGGI